MYLYLIKFGVNLFQKIMLTRKQNIQADTIKPFWNVWIIESQQNFHKNFFPASSMENPEFPPQLLILKSDGAPSFLLLFTRAQQPIINSINKSRWTHRWLRNQKEMESLTNSLQPFLNSNSKFDTIYQNCKFPCFLFINISAVIAVFVTEYFHFFALRNVSRVRIRFYAIWPFSAFILN